MTYSKRDFSLALAALFVVMCMSGVLVPVAAAQSPATPAANYTVLPQSSTTDSGLGVFIIGGSGTITFCSGYVNVGNGFGNMSLGDPYGSCIKLGQISTPVSGWTYAPPQLAILTLVNNSTGEVMRCSAITNSNISTVPPVGTCKTFGTAPK